MTGEGKIPVGRPLLPAAAALLPYLARIDAARHYSNAGPLSRALERRLAARFGVPADGVATFSSGTAALGCALRAVTGARRGRCLMPSWTFAATAAAACDAGLQPYFVDVDAEAWSLDPRALQARTDLDGVAAVVAVAPFGAAVDVASWDRFTAATGIPVVIDAAASFDALDSEPAFGRTPVMISLHATKTLPAAEGGLLVGTDAAVIGRCRSLATFGFRGDRTAHEAGTNAKLSEYHAAIALAALDAWPAVRQQWRDRAAWYRAGLEGIDGIRVPACHSGGLASSTFSVTVGDNGTALAGALSALGIETRRWWGDGCHAQPAYAGCGRDALPNTAHLCRAVLGLPMFVDLERHQVERVCRAVARHVGRAVVS